MTITSLLTFRVKKSSPELIAPAKQTPYEFKNLSDIDSQIFYRFHLTWIQFYRNSVGMEGGDPVKVFRERIAKALVYYYPLAGRLRRGTNHKLIVECNGEGIMYVEADAYVKLEQFGKVLEPPFPGIENLLYDGPGLDALCDAPLLLIQVTRLICGGFTFAVHFNHTMGDAMGMFQFFKAVAEMGIGTGVPSIQPVWKRELLNARTPPRVSCIHNIYQNLQDTKGTLFLGNTTLTTRSFFFGSQEVAGLRSLLPPHLLSCTRYELFSASLWRCRTIALSPHSDDKVGLVCLVDARRKFNPPLPAGYYGNVVAVPGALSTAGNLCQRPLAYAVDLVRKAKEDVTEEFMRSWADTSVEKLMPKSKLSPLWYYVDDLTRSGTKDADFGWGELVYSGLKH